MRGSTFRVETQYRRISALAPPARQANASCSEEKIRKPRCQPWWNIAASPQRQTEAEHDKVSETNENAAGHANKNITTTRESTEGNGHQHYHERRPWRRQAAMQLRVEQGTKLRRQIRMQREVIQNLGN